MTTREARVWNPATNEWDKVGIQPGPTGPMGPRGPVGPEGPQGEVGPGNSLSIGTVQKGEQADAQITGTPPNQSLSLTLPAGDQGPAATIAVGKVTTLPAGANATVANTGTTGAAVFDFGIPKGADGAGDIIPIGSIFPFAGTNVPSGWLLCDGSDYDSGTYPKLSAAIGATFGTKVPNLSGRFPLGANATYPIGTTGGQSSINKVVAHQHSVSGSVSVSVSQDNGLSVSGSTTFDGSHGHTASGTGTTTQNESTHDHGNVLTEVSGNRENRNTNSPGTPTVASIGSTIGRTAASYLGHNHTIVFSVPCDTQGGHSHSISGSTGAHSHTASGSLSGASAASTGDATVDVLNPFLAINYIIKAA